MKIPPIWTDFCSAAARLGVSIDEPTLHRFITYTARLQEANRRLNLTGLQKTEEIIEKIHLDSLGMLGPIARAAGLGIDELRERRWRVLDVGAGAGAPGLPFLFVCPRMQLTLLDARGKKVAFLREIIRELDLSARAVQERAETLAHQPEHRQQYPLVLARAVAALPTLAELTLPFVEIGGMAALPKGPKAQRECADAAHAIALLGGDPPQIHPILIPGGDVQRWLVIVRKSSPTPAQFPRRPGLPAKRPLSP